jgi:hypothetical protein
MIILTLIGGKGKFYEFNELGYRGRISRVAHRVSRVGRRRENIPLSLLKLKWSLFYYFLSKTANSKRVLAKTTRLTARTVFIKVTGSILVNFRITAPITRRIAITINIWDKFFIPTSF